MDEILIKVESKIIPFTGEIENIEIKVPVLIRNFILVVLNHAMSSVMCDGSAKANAVYQAGFSYHQGFVVRNWLILKDYFLDHLHQDLYDIVLLT